MARPLDRGQSGTTALAAVLVLAARTTHAAATLTWPGAPPCNGTLQACVTSAGYGDTVEIATNGPINESISFQQSLTLRAAAGFHPLFAAGRSITGNSPTAGSNAIHIEGLTLLRGTIEVIQQSAGELVATIVGNTTLDATEVGLSLQFIPGATGDVSFDISENRVGVPAYRVDDVGINAVLNGNATGRIANNSIAMGEAEDGFGIDVYDTAGSLDVDVIGNRLSETKCDAGIAVLAGEGGPAQVRILDNLVTGQGGSSGLAGAIALEADAPGPFVATVANNTVADNDIGIITRGNLMTGRVANNIAARNAIWGIRIDPPQLANANNLVFGNGADPFTQGPGTVTTDPHFVGSDNYHLTPGSPARDAGDDGSVPSDLSTDLDGNPRTQGSHVDIGALEAPAPSPAGTPRAFTGELEIEIGGAQLSPTIYGHGNAVLNAGVAPPSFAIPAGAFVAHTQVASFLSQTKPTTRQLLSLTGQNAPGTFGAQSRQMPFAGLLRFQRFAFPPILGTAMGSIDAAHIGAPGRTSALFTYLALTTTQIIPTTRTHLGVAALTGQSFAVSKDSRTPAGGGFIQLVAPFSFTSSLSTWSGPSSVTLALDFAPEPDRLALGAIAIAVLCGVGLAKQGALRDSQRSVCT